MRLHVNIYWLVADGVPFYAGKTIFSPEKRLREHFKAARRYPKRKISKALRSIGRKAVSIELKETVPPDGRWQDREQFWVAELRRVNPNAANSNDGGNGNKGHVHTDDTKLMLKIRMTPGNRNLSDEELYEQVRIAKIENYRLWVAKCKRCVPEPLEFPVAKVKPLPLSSKVLRRIRELVA